MHNVAFGFLFLIFLVNKCWANVEMQTLQGSGDYSIRLTKRIEREDFQALQTAIATLKEKGASLHMNAITFDSLGGDPLVAGEIGRLIRKLGLNTYVGPKDGCYSACIYAFIGGITRMAYGEVSVHRARFAGVIDDDSIKRLIPQRASQKNDYIVEMGVSFLLADAIETTPNWALRRLTTAELRRWGVHGISHVDDEILTRKAASTAGLFLNQFNDAYVKYRERCDREAMKFERLVLDCVVRATKEKPNFFEKLISHWTDLARNRYLIPNKNINRNFAI